MEKADQILELLKCGDKGGLELLFRHFYRPLVMYALKFVFFQEEAEDIVQEVFVKFWEQRKFDQVNHFLRSYLYQSVKNRCLSIMELKRGISMTSMDSLLDFSDSEAPDESEWDERVNQIYREIDRLPERTRVIFMAVVMEGKRYKEVADDLNISLNTVKTALSRALSTLRSNLNDKTFLFLFRLFTRK
ncbi:RNA polymerase sigma-70 factor [Butyricimonas paravirosa]